METNWFDPWMLAPLLAAPAIIVDPYTVYCLLEARDVAVNSPIMDDAADAVNASAVEESR